MESLIQWVEIWVCILSYKHLGATDAVGSQNTI